MHLVKYRGDHFKCIDDTGEILVHPKITRFVGQNEAGKTSLLELLSLLRPLSGTAVFALEDYPRNKFNRYKQEHEKAPHTPIHAEFQLSNEELALIEEEFGPNVLENSTFKLWKKYGAKNNHFSLSLNEAAYVKHFLKNANLDADIRDLLKKVKTLEELRSELNKLNDDTKSLAKEVPENLYQAIYKKLSVPSFFYFDEYATLPGEISLKKLQRYIETENYKGEDAQSLATAKALIDFAGADIEEFLSQDNYERLRADLEAASNEITDQLRRFWSSNQNLEIRFELQPKLNQNNQLEDTILHVRVYNTKHRVTVPFHKRSKGFVWFFSFLVAFSEYKDRDEKIILLLDEPGLNLGAIAQRDLMTYFEEELSPHHQILYTTHSPFMIDPRQLDTVRTVEDEEGLGTKVSNDPCRHKSETLFPLQAALGYDLSQTFFVAPNNLLVEGPSDLIYFNLVTQALEAGGKAGLTQAWTPVPVGGADKIASFVSLLGSQGLTLAVFMDVSSTDQQRLDSILKNKLLQKKRLVTVGSILGRPEADVEDLFSVDAYLNLVSRSYSNELDRAITEKDLTDRSPRIVKRLESHFAANGIHRGKFNHYKPAYDLMMNPSWIPEILDEETLLNFEKAFAMLNGLIDAGAPTAKVAHALPTKGRNKAAVAELQH